MAHPQQTSHPKLEATSSSTLQGDHGQSHSPVGPPLRKSSASRSEEDMDVDEDQEGEGMLDVKYDGDDNGGDEGLREGNVGTEGDDDPGDEEVRSGGGFERRSEARSSSSPSPSASQASKTRTKTPTSAEKQRRRRPKASKLIGTPHSQHETEERPRKSPHSPSSSISTNRNENDTSADDVAPETAAAAVGGNEDQDDAAAVGDDDRENESAMDWDDLEQRFEEKMGECREKEEGIRRELEKWIQIYHIWSTAGSLRDEERARKRLKTRIAHVKITEEKLEEKRAHYQNVHQAFQSALALLGGGDDSDDEEEEET